MSSRGCLGPRIFHFWLSLTTQTKSIDAMVSQLLFHWRSISDVFGGSFDGWRRFWFWRWWLWFLYRLFLRDLLLRWWLNSLRNRLNRENLGHLFLFKVISRRLTVRSRALSIISASSHGEKLFILGELLSQISSVDFEILSWILLFFFCILFVLCLNLLDALVHIDLAVDN